MKDAITRAKNMAAILAALQNGKITTAELYDSVGHHLQKDIERAERLGLIEREKVPQNGRGYPKIYNSLTAKGRKLFTLLQGAD